MFELYLAECVGRVMLITGNLVFSKQCPTVNVNCEWILPDNELVVNSTAYA